MMFSSATQAMIITELTDVENETADAAEFQRCRY